MKEQFVTYEISQKLRELGFNEECCGIYNPIFLFDGCWTTTNSFISKFNLKESNIVCAAPLWQQCLDWLREKHGLYVYFKPDKPNNIGDIEYVIEEHWSDEVICREIHMCYEFAREEGILKALTLIK